MGKIKFLLKRAGVTVMIEDYMAESYYEPTPKTSADLRRAMLKAYELGRQSQWRETQVKVEKLMKELGI